MDRPAGDLSPQVSRPAVRRRATGATGRHAESGRTFRRVALGVSRGDRYHRGMSPTPVHLSDAHHRATVIEILPAESWFKLLYDVYCPKCRRYLIRNVSTRSLAQDLALNHRERYGEPIPKGFLATFVAGEDPEA